MQYSVSEIIESTAAVFLKANSIILLLTHRLCTESRPFPRRDYAQKPYSGVSGMEGRIVFAVQNNLSKGPDTALNDLCLEALTQV